MNTMKDEASEAASQAPPLPEKRTVGCSYSPMQVEFRLP